MEKIRKNNQNPQKTQILGVGINFQTLEEVLSGVEKWVNSNKRYQITTPNPEQLVLAQKDEGFKKTLNQTDLAIPDGVGIVWAAKILANNKFSNCKLGRLTGIDLMIELCKLAAKQNRQVFLLGAQNKTAQKAAEELRIKYQLTKIEYSEGAGDIKNESEVERTEIIKKINCFKPDFLFVAYGAPFQEKWISENLPYLKVKVAMSVGGAFDYLSGKVQRSPNWIRKIGLEWFWRLTRQPWRLTRQLRLIKFAFLVLKEKIRGNVA